MSPARGPAPAPAADGAARPDRPGARPDRRADEERARYRRRRAAAGVLLVVLLLAGLGGGTWWLLGRIGPGVDQVRVDGAHGVAESDVRTAAAVAPGTPLAAVDTVAVAARVSGIPGVADVDVSRSWPHTLVVAVTERTPVALADTPDGPMLVDTTGLAYRTPPAQPPRLPHLQLPRVAPDDPLTTAAVAVVTALSPDVRDQVDTVLPGPSGTTLELALTNDRRVLWGRWAGTDPAVTARRAAVLGPLLTRDGAVYDVSSPELPTVRK